MSSPVVNGPARIYLPFGGGRFWSDLPAPHFNVGTAVTILAGLATLGALLYTSRGRPKSPWSHRKRKNALSTQQWRSLFMPDGKMRDGGVKFVKIVRSGGIDPELRAEVWPFLLGVYDLSSSRKDRDMIKTRNRKEYVKLRSQCQHVLNCSNVSVEDVIDSGSVIHETDSPSSEDVDSARKFLSIDEKSPNNQYLKGSSGLLDGIESSTVTKEDAFALNKDSSGSDSSEDSEVIQDSQFLEGKEENDPEMASRDKPSRTEIKSKLPTKEDFVTWQRIIRVDAIRANSEWKPYSPSQAAVSDVRAHRFAEAVGLKDYDHLEPCRIFHAARLVAILEAYALYDPEIGYCQGMSDLLSPIIAVITEDQEAFWCFVGFMRKARHNFRLDEVGIKKQLNIVSKIIKCKDSRLYRHLEKLEAEDCFFVYRMVVVLFRRELTFEQTICLWEVVWADQTAVRAGIGKSALSRIRLSTPPTEDLLLYAIAASVLQRRKLIIEKYSSMEEILRECNSMAGQLDVWKLLDDAHNLVVSLHNKIECSL